MAREAGADREAVRGMTHAAASRDAFDGYDVPTWERICGEVLKLPAVVPESDNAPGNAPGSRRSLLNYRRNARHTMCCARRSRRHTGARTRWESRRLPLFVGALWGDSAPDSATRGALLGELAAQSWAERLIVAGEWEA